MRRLAHVLVAAAAMGGLWPAVGQSAAPTDGNALRAQLPAPGQKPLAGTREFVGVDRGGRYAIAVVVHRNGAAVAYVCDGRRTWRWLTGSARGGRLRASGDRGARLSGTVGSSALRATLRLAGRARTVTLARAVGAAGLRRLTDTADGRPFEAAWVVTNGGVIRGVGTVARTPVLATDSSATKPLVEVPPPGADEATVRIFTKARCAINVLKLNIAYAKIAQGNDVEQAKLDRDLALARLAALHCDEAVGGATP